MEITARTVRLILDRVSAKTQFTQDFTGFREMSNEIGLKNEDYLYKKMFLKIKRKGEKSMIGLGRLQLNLIADFLGFNSFHQMENELNTSLSPQLTTFVGSYYCYVRANQPTSLVFRSPVRISVKDAAILFELKGPKMTYRGEAQTKKGCLFILMSAKEGKVFHHVYKVGEREKPEVLQGVFTGVSTAYDPIGGRVILIKQETDFKELTNKSLTPVNMKKSKLKGERVLASYFKEYNNNNVAPEKSGSFTIEDLR